MPTEAANDGVFIVAARSMDRKVKPLKTTFRFRDLRTRACFNDVINI